MSLCSCLSNVNYSNGMLDPWSSGGIMSDINDSVVSLIILMGAHHLDLRAESIHDPPQVRMVREKEQQHIKKWIKQANEWNGKRESNRHGPDLHNLALMFDDL